MSEWNTGVWISAKVAMPQSGRIVLAFYKNRSGMERIIRAAWVAENSEEAADDLDEIGVYNESDDTYYWPEDWYEQIDNWAAYSAVAVREGEITHWMPLPVGPELEEDE